MVVQSRRFANQFTFEPRADNNGEVKRSEFAFYLLGQWKTGLGPWMGRRGRTRFAEVGPVPGERNILMT